MGGDATFAGTNYQASVIAYVSPTFSRKQSFDGLGSPTTHPPPCRVAERHYYVIEVSPEMLIEALTPGRPLQTASDVFSLLAAPTMNVDTAATALVRGVKMVALQDVKTSTAGRVIREGLEAMALSFQPLAVARAVVRVANAELVLLPRELQLVKGASVEFLKSRALRS